MEGKGESLFTGGKQNHFSIDRSFQEEFTRQFISSTEEVEPGFYSLHSGTNKYDMMIPVETIVDGMSYTLGSNMDYESFLCYIERGEWGTAHLQVTFFAVNNMRFVQDYLAVTQSHAGEKLEFDKTILPLKDLYVALGADHRLNKVKRSGYIGYIQNTAGNGGMQFYYDIFMKPESAVLHQEIKASEKETFHRIMRSVSFLSEGGAANES
ncbi:hypothetical protein [Jeotgalibacillus campisalis]|uniref:Uncharacterized protein n=1 Tax=Jeotgalibacillus campisalis TaxID=220754 RepID=A0A0C2RL69_9BACL|nr:hypothetical protein [Jeotgalibacillus campisalis]KIL50980.1 hypothetical protein KR50_08610 [Jeotgalibacillus campisalis]